jgi:putative tricarboxylic transport membrane protein
MERALRQSLEMSRGDFSILFTRPISAGLLALAALFVASSFFRMSKAVKEDTVV